MSTTLINIGYDGQLLGLQYYVRVGMYSIAPIYEINVDKLLNNSNNIYMYNQYKAKSNETMYTWFHLTLLCINYINGFG